MSVNRIYRHVCCEMNVFFFDVFIDHFPKIHRSVLRIFVCISLTLYWPFDKFLCFSESGIIASSPG